MDRLKAVRKHVNMSFTFAAVLAQKTAFLKGVLLRRNFSNLTEKHKNKNRKSLKPAPRHARKALLVRLKSQEGDDSTKLNLWIVEEVFVVNHEKLGRSRQPVDGDVPPFCHLQEKKLLRVKSSQEKKHFHSSQFGHPEQLFSTSKFKI